MNRSLREILRPAAGLLVVMTILTGLVYPLAVTGLARVFFPRQASGSVITRNGVPMGSALIGQPFDDPRYFWPRPSATSPFAYNAAASSGSNLGPTNPALARAVKARIQALRRADPDNHDPVPVDLVTASASGLDPDISPAAAVFQLHRVARARNLPVQQVQDLVTRFTQPRQLGILGEPRVNVLMLNMALDALATTSQAAGPRTALLR